MGEDKFASHAKVKSATLDGLNEEPRNAGLLYAYPMSALGHKRTYAVQKGMSALPPKADMCSAIVNVR
jgi:hypothetical protein